jgi:hypothetical protein
MIRLSGRMTPRVIASRSSATFLPEKSSGVRDAALDAADAVAAPVLRAPFAAVCWRPRALPPAFAARLRAGLLELLLLLARALGFAAERVLDLRAVEPDLRALELELVLDLRALALAPEDLRALAGLLALLRERVPPDDDELFRDDDARDRLPEDDRPPLPLFDSAIFFLLLRNLRPLSARAGRTISCPRKP